MNGDLSASGKAVIGSVTVALDQRGIVSVSAGPAATEGVWKRVY